MLERLEDAFTRRDRSEAQLRRFVSSASHELRTPLTSIRGYAALLRRGAGQHPEDLERSISRIESEATRMAGLIDDLLLLARLDEERPLPAPASTWRRLLATRSTMLGQGSPTTDHGRSRQPVMLSGDEPRVRQIVANLLENAQVHTRAVRLSGSRSEFATAMRSWR